jgi:hypothetical protein
MAIKRAAKVSSKIVQNIDFASIIYDDGWIYS